MVESPPMPRRGVLVALGLAPAAMVLGRQAWALANQVEISTDARWRYIVSNGVPGHATGSFPNRNNPNRISAQSYRFKTPLNPRANATVQPVTGQLFGVAVNGVPFDPATAEFWNRDRRSGWNYEAIGGAVNLGLDRNNAHVQPTGAYHYHGVPTGLIERWSPETHSAVIGYAADGFPVYVIYGFANGQDPRRGVRPLRSSWQLRDGTRPDGPGGRYDGTFTADYEYVAGSGDLHKANGRFGPTPDYPQGIYAYFLTAMFPYIPRWFRGTPDASFRHVPPAGMQEGRPGNSRGSGPRGLRPEPGNGPRMGPPPLGRPPPPGGRWPPPRG